MRLHILTPDDLQSNMATFTNDCGAQGPFGVTMVTARVDPSDGCPDMFNFAADVSANGGGGVGTVTYQWERSDGTFGPVLTLSFNGAGTQTVADYWYPPEEGSFWVRVHVLTPNDLVSNDAGFSYYCGCWWCDAASRR